MYAIWTCDNVVSYMRGTKCYDDTEEVEMLFALRKPKGINWKMVLGLSFEGWRQFYFEMIMWMIFSGRSHRMNKDM